MSLSCFVEFIYKSANSYMSSPNFVPFDLVCSCEPKGLDFDGYVSYLSSLASFVVDGGYICSNDTFVSRESIAAEEVIPINSISGGCKFDGLLYSSLNFNQNNKKCREQKYSVFKKTKEGLIPIDCYVLTYSSLWSKPNDVDELFLHAMQKYTSSGERILSLFTPSDTILDFCMSCNRMFYCFCDRDVLYNKADV